jgi:hypothetical protein
MYSTTTPASGTVFIPIFVGATPTGERIRITPSEVGLRRAEVLGRLTRLRANPDLLRHYAEAYERLHAGSGPLVAIDLVYEIHHLRAGAPTDYRRRTILRWRRA